MLTNTGCRALIEGSFAKLWLSRGDPETFLFPQGSPTGPQSNLCAAAKGQGDGAAACLQRIQLGTKGAEMILPSSSYLIVQQALY